jgi:hypothetical protein
LGQASHQRAADQRRGAELEVKLDALVVLFDLWWWRPVDSARSARADLEEGAALHDDIVMQLGELAHVRRRLAGVVRRPAA